MTLKANRFHGWNKQSYFQAYSAMKEAAGDSRILNTIYKVGSAQSGISEFKKTLGRGMFKKTAPVLCI